MIIFGTRSFGVTDTVPGLFHVETRFFHVNCMPLWPMRSYLVIAGRQGGVHIPLSGRSIMVAWLRFLGGLAAIVSIMATIGSLGDLDDDDDPYSSSGSSNNKGAASPQTIAAFLSFMAFSFAFAYIAFNSKSLRNATHERATKLCGYLGPTAGPSFQRLVDRHFSILARGGGGNEPGSVAMAEAVVLTDDLELAMGTTATGNGGGMSPTATTTNHKGQKYEGLPSAQAIQVV